MAEVKGRRAEDTARGCRVRADHNREEASSELNEQMRARLESSADAWTKRANLLQRLETSRERD